MTGRHRSPRPPGNVAIYCTGRGRHDEQRVRTLQLVRLGDEIHVKWSPREGAPPVTGLRDAGGYLTYELRCRRCGRHLKIGERKLVLAAMRLAEMQGISGDDNSPIRLDLSVLEAAAT